MKRIDLIIRSKNIIMNIIEKNEKKILEKELNNFKNEKNQLENQKCYYINNKESIKENIKQKDKNIILIILDLLKIYNRIKNIAMNPNHEDIENEYVEESIQRLEDIGSDKIQIKKLKEFQKYNKIFNEIKGLSEEELIINGTEFFIDKIKKLL